MSCSSELTSDLGHLFRQEVQLAKTEAREEVKQVGKGAGMLAGAGLSAWLALVMLSLTLAWCLDKALDRAVSFLLVGLDRGPVVAAVLAIVGKQQVARARAASRNGSNTQGGCAMGQSTEELKRDIEQTPRRHERHARRDRGPGEPEPNDPAPQEPGGRVGARASRAA